MLRVKKRGAPAISSVIGDSINLVNSFIRGNERRGSLYGNVSVQAHGNGVDVKLMRDLLSRSSSMGTKGHHPSALSAYERAHSTN